MMRCSQCQWKYPEGLLSSLHTNRGTSPPVCGICALELGNVMLGQHRTFFTGAVAESMRVNALAWRNRFPHHKPKEKKGTTP